MPPALVLISSAKPSMVIAKKKSRTPLQVGTGEEGAREQGCDRDRKGMWTRSVRKGARSNESAKEREV